MGTIQFWIKDTHGESEEITLHNMIYLSGCPNTKSQLRAGVKIEFIIVEYLQEENTQYSFGIITDLKR